MPPCIPSPLFHYIDGGADDEVTLSRNTAAFEACDLVPNVLAGVEDIDLEAATERGVIVTHCPTEANWGGVAEGTLAFMLALLKRVRERDRSRRPDTPTVPGPSCCSTRPAGRRARVPRTVPVRSAEAFDP